MHHQYPPYRPIRTARKCSTRLVGHFCFKMLPTYCPINCKNENESLLPSMRARDSLTSLIQLFYS